MKCLVRNFSVKWWSSILINEKNKQIEKVIQNNMLKLQRSPATVKEFSLKKIHQNLQQRFPHETAEQIKNRLQKAYIDQMTEIFPDDEEILSQQSDETVPEQWDHDHHSQQKAGPSHRPGKEPIIEEESDF
ncbi:hypothetical protein M5K25_002709 [Dendrobium thyrsiflorum]|uniref:Uncharacterized protein n=1 Tax=Dendrobium thyrsiflorum TaxID=117978 RepID=A0ABD0VN21_DENTH